MADEAHDHVQGLVNEAIAANGDLALLTEALTAIQAAYNAERCLRIEREKERDAARADSRAAKKHLQIICEVVTALNPKKAKKCQSKVPSQ